MSLTTEDDVVAWLRCDDPVKLESLWQSADRVRKQHVGDAVHLRGLVEFSNYCRRDCAYCGIRAHNPLIRRYRMNADEILDCAHEARELGYGTVVLQSGEDPAFGAEDIARIVRRIKRETGLAVTLSLGERDPDELALWREAGADRYLLRFETSDTALFSVIHPTFEHRASGAGVPSDRIGLLRILRDYGYEIGSGVMVGIPGQSTRSLARDILLFRELDLDMIGVGPYLRHPATPLGSDWKGPEAGMNQVPSSEDMVCKVVALTRLVCPEANIPSTTALATLNRVSGRELGLLRGANVVMPNLTPLAYRRDYEIYPSKVCIDESGEDCQRCLVRRILSLGREVGSGAGGRRRGTETPVRGARPDPLAEESEPNRRRLPTLNRGQR